MVFELVVTKIIFEFTHFDGGSRVDWTYFDIELIGKLYCQDFRSYYVGRAVREFLI